jgi:hypothetical protein
MAFAMLTTIQIRMVGAVTATTSMTFTSQTYDGYVYRDAGDTYETVRTADYATATVSESTTCRVGQKYIGEVYRIDRDFLYFDTSMIPSDAAITSAFLRLYVQTDSSATDFNVTIQHSMSHPDTPFTTYDYNYLYYSGNGGSKNTSGITILVYWNITLNDEGISWIDVDGTTKLCLRSNNDIDGTAPTGSEYIVFWSAEKGEAYAPTLYVTYIFNGSQLTIESLPTNTAFTLNGTSESTPYSGALENGTYLINFSSSFVRSGLTWSFSYWNDNTSNTNPIRTINLQSNSSYSVTYTSAYAQSTFTGFGPVFECAMNNMFELDSISESMIGNVQRQMLLDSSAYGNHGHMYPITSPYGGPTLTWGAMGKGLRLDGTDDTVIVPSSLSLNISEALTVEFWMSVDNGTTNQIMISKPNEWHIAILNNSLYAGVYTTGGNYWIESNTTLPDGAFLYVALAYDYRYANASLYINSWLDSSVATDGNPIGLQNSDLYLGSFNNASSYFKGVLDEVRIFPYMKPSGGIYSDAGTGIVKFDSMNFVASSRQEYVGMPVIATEGVIPTYTGLTTNDWQLPWAYANDTYWTTAIRAASYMAGFQSYQLYCNAKFTFSGTMCRSYIHWYWLFFRDGRLQVAYMLELCPIYAVGSAISKWHVRFVRATSYYTNVTMLDYEFYTNYTLYPNSIPIIVSAWIGPDNTHFTIRLDVQDSRMITAYDGSYVTPFVYSFELVDENVNPHLAAWFDGWAVSGIKIETNSYVASWARMEIESHKWFWDPIVIVAQKVVNWVWSAFSTPRNLMVPPDPSVPSQPPSIVQVITTEIVNALMPIAEIIATAVKSIGEPIVNALAGLSHDIIGAVFGLGTVFMQALAPVGQLLLDIGGGFVSALLDGMGVIAKFFTDALYDAGIALASALNDVFGLLGWSGGYTTLSGWVGSGWSWMVSSMTYSISLFPAFFTFLGGWLTGFMEIVVSAFSWWAMEISMIGNFLTGSYGVGVNFWTEYNLTQWIGLVLICYPIFLVFMWDERGLGAVIDHITFMYNSFHLLAYILLTMIHYISSMITRLIELIPVAE